MRPLPAREKRAYSLPWFSAAAVLLPVSAVGDFSGLDASWEQPNSASAAWNLVRASGRSGLCQSHTGSDRLLHQPVLRGGLSPADLIAGPRTFLSTVQSPGGRVRQRQWPRFRVLSGASPAGSTAPPLARTRPTPVW